MNEPTFHVLVVAPLLASEDFSTNDGWPGLVRFEAGAFDEAMASVAPAIAIDVPEAPGARGAARKPVRVDLTFRAMRAFRPDVLAKDVPFLAELAGSAEAGTPATAPRGGSLVEDILADMGSSSASSPSSPGSAALASVVEHPAVRGLERAWAGLHFLASRAGRESVVVSAVAAQGDEVTGVLERLARRVDGSPIDLVIVDHTLGSSPRDLERVAAWAACAEALGAPLVANGLPELVGMADLRSLGKSERRLRSAEDPRASAVRSVAERDVTRWITLVANGALARPRHAGPVKRTPGLTFDEREELFLGPGYLVAALAAASFTRTGWPCAITGPVHGRVENLPVHMADDRGTGVATPLEAHVTETAAAEAAAAGLAVLVSAANKDVAVMAHAPTLHRGPRIRGGESPAAAHGLADQLFVARLARVVDQLAAAVPPDAPEAALRDVVLLALAELFGDAKKMPAVEVAIAGMPRCLEVTVRPRGFLDVRLEEVTLGAALG